MLSRSSQRYRTERYPLPATVDGIANLVKEVLNGGRVQRIEIDVNAPVKVVRELLEESLEEADSDLEAALRNVEIEEYVPPVGESPLIILSEMVKRVNLRRLNPSCWAVGHDSILSQWVKEWVDLNNVPGFYGRKHLLGSPVCEVGDLSSDTLILVGSPLPSYGTDGISLAVKTSMEVRRSNEPKRVSPTSDPVRGHPKKRPAGAGKLEDAGP